MTWQRIKQSSRKTEVSSCLVIPFLFNESMVCCRGSHHPVWNSSLLCGFAGADFHSSQIWSRFEGSRRTRSFSGKQWKFKKHDFTQGHFADSRVVFLKELVLALRTGNVRIRAFWVGGIWTSVAIMRGADKLDAGVFSPVFVAFMREDVAQERSTTDPEDGALVPKQQTRKDCSWGVRLGVRAWMSPDDESDQWADSKSFYVHVGPFIIHYSEDLQVKTARGTLAVSLQAKLSIDLFTAVDNGFGVSGFGSFQNTLISPFYCIDMAEPTFHLKSSPLYHITKMIQSIEWLSGWSRRDHPEKRSCVTATELEQNSPTGHGSVLDGDCVQTSRLLVHVWANISFLFWWSQTNYYQSHEEEKHIWLWRIYHTSKWTCL